MSNNGKKDAALLERLQRETEAAIQQGDLGRAEDLIFRIVEEGPPFAYGLYQLGLLYYNRGRADAAAGQLLKALEAAPEMISARFLLGKIYLEKNEPKKAMEQFRTIIGIDPADDEAYFLLARCCLMLDMTSEVLSLIDKAHSLNPGNAEYIEALGALYFRRGDYSEAFRYLSDGALEKSDRVETWNLLSECSEKIGNKRRQLLALERSVEIDPDQTDKSAKLEGLRKLPGMTGAVIRKKIAFFSNIDSFLGDITGHLSKRYEVKKVDVRSADEIARYMEWSDLSWFEWCDSLLVQASQMRKTAPVVCRLHRYEAFTPFPGQVNWENVDHLICPFQPIIDVLRSQIDMQTPVTIIPNGLDFTQYTIPENKQYGKKIAYVGYLKKQKAPELLLQCFAAIHRYDPEYTLHIAGEYQDLEAQVYCEHMLKKLDLPVHFYGWVKPVSKWLEDKDYIISSSISESFQYSVVEGIARGLLPLVHSWPGSDLIYPGECIYGTFDECLNIIRDYEKCDKIAVAQSYRNIMEKRFSLENQLEAIGELIEQYIGT